LAAKISPKCLRRSLESIPLIG